MSDLFFKNVILLSGQNAPTTGDWQSIAASREVLFTVFCSGQGGDVSLQYRNPFFDNDDGITFYAFSGVGSGYSDPAFSTSPMSQVRAICNGTGNFWVAASVQN